MSDRLLVSVVLPVYNGRRYLTEAIDSVLAQTYRPLELIVIDDGSSDGTRTVAVGYGDRLRYFHQPNAGQGAARNTGVRHASGQLFAFLDADDIWLPDKLALQVAALQKDSSVDMVFGHVVQFKSPNLARDDDSTPVVEDSEPMPGHNATCLMVRRSSYQRVGSFDTTLRVGEFLDWYLKATEQSLGILTLPEVVARRRVHDNNIGIRERQHRADLLRPLKASLDRRRAAAGAQRAPAFFAAAYRIYEQAERAAGGPVDRFFDIGGRVIRLRFAGEALVRNLTRALAHRAAAPTDAPALTVCAWDDASTGTHMPPLPWSRRDLTPLGEVDGYQDRRFRTLLQPGFNALNVMDLERNLAGFWVRDATQLPYYEKGAPLRFILHACLSRHGLQLIHAAAVGTASGCAILAGQGGSGKSTTAIACVIDGMNYVADDYCLLGEGPRAHSLYNSAKLDWDAVDRMPEIRSAISSAQAGDEKALLFVHEYLADQVQASLPIKALLVPRITGERCTTLEPVAGLEGMRALAPSTMRQLPGTDAATWLTLSAFVKQVPCYRLRLGQDVTNAPDLIRQLVQVA